ncbi:MAG: leucine-rich repeat protein [Lachnospiraceae bacterium]|nr:leucine-rich repeat protein [Lachnospiraceae bacterium]
MKQRIVKSIFALSLSAAMVVGMIPTTTGEVLAASSIEEIVEENLTFREAEVKQLLTEDLTLPTTVDGLSDASITYSVGNADARWVSVEGNVLKVTRPYAGAGNYEFTLYATVTAEGDTYTKEIPLTVWEGFAEDSYAGYIYVSFAVERVKEESDVQQLHFFLSEDGLNWTAVNGCNPVFLTGDDYADKIESCGPGSVNYEVKAGTDISKTVTGDASVLFPFEGDDQGVRDPYLIRGVREEDKGKTWILATDLNTHDAENYDGNKLTNTCGKWELTNVNGSTCLFVWETEDYVNWTRRYIDVGIKDENGDETICMAWAPEAIYNPQKDNYLVYWSARTTVDGRTRDRVYCNETSDFVTFGPTKLYEQDPFFENYKPNGVGGNNSGYGTIDTSMLWVEDETGNPYGKLYRLTKDETNNHIELYCADTVLDSSVDYDASVAHKITPYELDGKKYTSLEDLSSITNEKNDIKKAEIVWNWFKNNATGDHFEKISQKGIEKYTGAYEGATMFKFIDRDEWCVMIDNYVPINVRYEPYTTTDLSDPDSIKKVTSGYGRTGGDIGTHGGMIPITVEEYNTIIDTYNSDETVENYHHIDYIEVDTRGLKYKAEELREAAKKTSLYTKDAIAQMNVLADKAEALYEENMCGTKVINNILTRADKLINNTLITLTKPEISAPITSVTPSTETEIVIDEGEAAPELPAEKSVHIVGSVKYEITKVDEYNTDGTNGTVTVKGMTKKNAKSVVIPDEVEIEGYSFAVNKIADKAFQNCKKLKTITIGDNVKSIGKNAFKGIKKNATFKVSSDNYATVKKLLKKKVGFKKPMKIKEV